jgi:hypothetical protein
LGSPRTRSTSSGPSREALKQKKLTHEEMRDYLETLQDKLVDVKTALADADEEQRGLQQRIKELEQYADIGKNFTPGYGVYWIDAYPYCPTCWDVDRKPVRLAGPQPQSLHRGKEDWKCPLHKIDYQINMRAQEEMHYAPQKQG